MTLDYLGFIRSESARFVDVLAGTDPAARVPSCPDWSAADLLWHLGEVQLFWATIVRDRLDDPEAAEAVKPERPGDYTALLDWYRASSAALIDALATTPDDTAVWTWFDDDQSVRFVRRRQAHEALIHRLDAELTAGARSDLDPDLATDGVKEVLDWMYSGVPPWAERGPAGPVGWIRTTDTGAQWLVQLGTLSGTSPNTGNTYTDEPTVTIVADGEPSFEVSGAAADLDAWLWNRPPVGAITRDGDAAAFEAAIRTGVQ